MARVCIFTFAFGDNYGAVLQAYALGEVIREKGHKVEYLNLTWSTWRYRIISKITPLSYRFNSFRQKYLRNFTCRCKDINDLRNLVKNPADVYIVGSDQVWNPDITAKRALHYFFDFLPDMVKRASYAASFGISNWERHELINEIADLLKKFTVVSVREKSGIEICKSTFNIKDVYQVLDPTLLLGRFDKLITEKNHRDSLVGFMFNPSKEYYNLLREISVICGYKILIMDLPNRKWGTEIFNFRRSPFSSPEQWVTNIAKSKFVVTDSFHCMVFAILFRRQFVFIPTNKAIMGRVTSLLESLDLMDRIYNSPMCVIKDEGYQSIIDYDAVHDKLSQLRAYSNDVLDKILQ